MRHLRASTLRRVSTLVASLAGIGLLASSAFAAPTSVIFMGGNVNSGKYYNTGLSSFQWTNRELTGATIVTEDDSFFLIGDEFDPFGGIASVNWGSPLILDSSTGGLADGMFDNGGTMTISGTIWDINTFTPLFTGTLFEANVSTFQLVESSPDSDRLVSVGDVTVTPTGGWLFDGIGNTSAHIDHQFSFQVGFNGESQNGGPGPIQSFDYDIWATSGSQFNMAQMVPEPATLALLGMGLVGCALRRRR